MTREEELIELLDKETISKECVSDDLSEQQVIIEKTFKQFEVQCKILHAGKAPRVNCFEYIIDGNSFKRLMLFKHEIREGIRAALGKREDIRLIPPMPSLLGCYLEIPNDCQTTVTAGELFRLPFWYLTQATLPLMLGKGWCGEPNILDLTRAPHLLIAGCTGSGKSVLLDSCIISLMFRHTPNELKLILVDSKIVEFSKYNDLPYLQFPLINSIKDTLRALQWLIMEMERRYKELSEAGCKDIKALNEQRPYTLPYIVMFINEFSDYMAMARTQMDALLSQLCAKSRAVGIHLIISTSRPCHDVLSRGIMANFPTRIGFRVATHIDSRNILDADDAMCLLGRGDMICRQPGRLASSFFTRIQGVYVNDQEIGRIVNRLKSMYGDMKPNTLPHTPVMWRNRTDALRDKLLDIVHHILQDKLDWLKDEIIDDTCDDIADSIIEHWDELKDVISDLDEEQSIDDVEEADSKEDECLSNEDSKLLLEAIQLVIESRRPTISFIQRMLGIGYNKASALLEAMERHSIVSPQKDSAMRSVLVNTYKEAVSRLPKQN